MQIAQAQRSLSIGEIANIARVDPGQTSRILDGQFKTLSGNVMLICMALGIDPHLHGSDDRPSEQAAVDAAWVRLEASVRRAWDQTPQGAERLARVIDAVAEVRRRAS